MDGPSSHYDETIDVTLDLRQLNIELKDRDDFFKVWKSLVKQLVGKPISSGELLKISEQRGDWNMLVLDSRNVTVINDNTRLNVVDLERPPEIRHACKEHAKNKETVFGPFFCPVCRDEKSADRLCETHANFLENKYTAYCFDHLPRCQCRKDCPDLATFECDRCRKPHSENLKKKHPHDPFTLLCSKCFIFQFELCSKCQTEGRKRLGKSRCAFPTGLGDERCGKRLCTLRHARQWQIWGPHWRGVVLCEDHFKYLSSARPADLLWMLIVSRAPAPFLQDKVKDLYRLRNIISYVRQYEFSWNEMDRTLRELEQRANSQSGIHKNIKDSFILLLKKLSNVQSDLPVIEAQLLLQVRAFYNRHLLRTDSSSAILGVNVKRVFGRESSQSYRISIRVGRDYNGRSMKGLLIGSKGALVNQLKSELNLQGVDFEE